MLDRAILGESNQQISLCSAIRLTIVFLSICIFSTPMGAWAHEFELNATNNSPYVCQAEEQYLSRIGASYETQAPELDYSCLTSMPAIAPELTSYQLIDIRLKDELDAALPNSWQMPVSQLKTKSFLRKRRLFLIGQGFSRVQAASDCAVLKNSGFDEIRILVGGIDTWHLYNRNPRARADTTIKAVSARQVLYEYLNNKVVFITASQEIAEHLKAVGMGDYVFVSELTPEKITSIVSTNSGEGFYPAIVVTDGAPINVQFKSPLHNLYELVGGVSGISAQIQENAVINYGRSVVPESFSCGNS